MVAGTSGKLGRQGSRIVHSRSCVLHEGVCAYIYIVREREGERESLFVRVCLWKMVKEEIAIQRENE